MSDFAMSEANLAVGGGMRIGPIIMGPDQMGPDAAQWRPGQVTLCSVIPRELRAFKRLASFTVDDIGKPPGMWQMKGRTLYIMPPASKNSYATLVVYDGIAKIPQPQTMQPDSRDVPVQVNTEPARRIAESLLSDWGGNLFGTSPECMPGIGIIQGVKPTEDEFNQLRLKHTNRCKQLVNEADTFADQKQLSAIGPQHKEALEFIGEQRDWRKSYIERKECYNCGQSLYVKQQSCRDCGNLVALAFDLGYTAETVPDRTLVEGMKRVMAKGKKLQ